MIFATYLEELNKWYHAIHADSDWASVSIIKKIEENLGLNFVARPYDEGNVCMANSPEIRDDYKATFSSIDLWNYIYAVLHSKSYREKHKHFLKIDFSRVHYPKDVQGFWNLVDLGGQLQQLPQSEIQRLIQEINAIEL